MTVDPWMFWKKSWVNTAPIARAPITDSTGKLDLPKGMLSGIWNGRRRSGSTKRRRITARWAVAKAKVAASAYTDAMRSIWAGTMSRAATIPNTMIETKGVRNRGWSRANTDGNSLLAAIE